MHPHQRTDGRRLRWHSVTAYRLSRSTCRGRVVPTVASRSPGLNPAYPASPAPLRNRRAAGPPIASSSRGDDRRDVATRLMAGFPASAWCVRLSISRAHSYIDLPEVRHVTLFVRLRTRASRQRLPVGIRDVRAVQPRHQPADAGLAALHAAGLRPRADVPGGCETLVVLTLMAAAALAVMCAPSTACAARSCVRVGCWLERPAGPAYLATAAVREPGWRRVAGAQPLRDIAQVPELHRYAGPRRSSSTRPGCRSSSL